MPEQPGPADATEPLSRADLRPVDESALIFPRPPQFDHPAAERRHRKERLVAALRLFGRFGFEEGVAGHITTRDPEYPDHFWVNPFGVSFKHIRVSDLLLVNHEGQVVQGRHRVNTVSISHENAKLTHQQVGNEFAGWFQFQPLYEQIARAEPDLFG